MTTTPISTFTVPVTFRGVAYDVEITPLMHGKPFLATDRRIGLWNEAEKFHNLFSKKIVEMLEDAVPADSDKMLTVGSKDGFEFEDKTTTTLKTAALWDQFIDYLEQPATYTAERPEIDDEPGREIGLDARLRLTHNVYLSLSPAKQQETQFNVFKKKCVEHFCKLYGVQPIEEITYSDTEKACIKVHLKPDMEPWQERLSLWVQQKDEETRGDWSTESRKIKMEIAKAATEVSKAAAISAEDSDPDLL